MRKQDEPELTPEAGRARETLGVLSEHPPRIDAAFRERLKADFVSGRIEQGAVGAARARRRGGADGLAARPRVIPLSRPWHARPSIRIATLAAAAMLAVVAGAILNRGPAWTVIASSGTGTALVEGVPIEIGRIDLLRDAIRAGVEVDLPPDGTLEIASPGALAIQLTPGTRLTVPPPPPRWLGRSSELHTRAGELRITTGPDFQGARLMVYTPDAAVQVTGTTLAVILEPGGTCVCVLEGRVKMGPHGQEMVEVPNGMRRFVFKDSSPPMMDTIRDMERTKLAMFRDALRPDLEGGATP